MVLSGVESFLVVLSGVRWLRVLYKGGCEGSSGSLLWCLGRSWGPQRVDLRALVGPVVCV